MARKNITIYSDDLTGEEGAQPVAFSIDGNDYEIDLVASSYKEFKKLLAPYIKAATVIKLSPESRKAVAGKTAQIREWAKSENLEVPARGRIPAAIIEAFEAAQK